MDLNTPMGKMGLDARQEMTAKLTEELGARVKTLDPAEGIKAAAFALQSSWSDGLTGEEWKAAASKALSLDENAQVNLPEPVPVQTPDPPPPEPPQAEPKPEPEEPAEDPEDEEPEAVKERSTSPKPRRKVHA